MAYVQSRLLRILQLRTATEGDFSKHNWHRKVCKRIRHDLQNGTLGVFPEENTMVQSIQSHQSQIRGYDITNKGSNQSGNADTSKKLENPFGITFEN